MQARRVYAEPVERDGVTIIPAASIAGGGGGGSQGDGNGSSDGGVGFGLVGKPVGAWVVKDGSAEWQPARVADVDRMISMLPMIGLVLLIAAWILRRA
jgi:uncharacterized spore protein YtfJ